MSAANLREEWPHIKAMLLKQTAEETATTESPAPAEGRADLLDGESFGLLPLSKIAYAKLQLWQSQR